MSMTDDNDRRDGGEHAGNMASDSIQSVPKRSEHDLEACINCGDPLPERRRRGSARRCCSPRCRKEAWLSTRGVSVPGKVGHVAHKRERLGRITDRAAAGLCSGRTVRRHLELDKLVGEMFGQDKADQLRQDMRAGNTAPVTTMLRAIKSQMAVPA